MNGTWQIGVHYSGGISGAWVPCSNPSPSPPGCHCWASERAAGKGRAHCTTLCTSVHALPTSSNACSWSCSSVHSWLCRRLIRSMCSSRIHVALPLLQVYLRVQKYWCSFHTGQSGVRTRSSGGKSFGWILIQYRMVGQGREPGAKVWC